MNNLNKVTSNLMKMEKKTVIMDIKSYNSLSEMRENLYSSKLRNKLFLKRFQEALQHKRRFSHNVKEVDENSFNELAYNDFIKAKLKNKKISNSLIGRVYNNRSIIKVDKKLVKRDYQVTKILPYFLKKKFGKELSKEEEKKIDFELNHSFLRQLSLNRSKRPNNRWRSLSERKGADSSSTLLKISDVKSIHSETKKRKKRKARFEHFRAAKVESEEADLKVVRAKLKLPWIGTKSRILSDRSFEQQSGLCSGLNASRHTESYCL
jgi:hypothetical protein